MIYQIINDEESVMGHLEDPDRNRRILCIVLSNVKFELVTRFLSVDGCIYARLPLVQHCKNCIIYIVIDDDNTHGGAFYQITNKLISIVYLSIKEDALLIVFGSFFKLGKYLLNLVICFQLANLKSVQALKDLGI